MTLRPIQSWYNKMSTRERLMLVAIVWVAVFLWARLLIGEIRQIVKDRHIALEQVALQNTVLDQKQKIESQLQAQKNQFAHTYSATELFGKVQNFAQDTNLINNVTINQQKAETKQIFNVNTVSVRFNQASVHDLVDFCSRILAERPYLAINEISLIPGTPDKRLMTGEIRINSLELKPGALDVSPTTETK